MAPDYADPTRTDSFVGRSQGLIPTNFRSPQKPIPQRAGHPDGLAMGHVRYGVKNVAPPGMEKTVKALKKEPGVDNPFALAWWMKGEGKGG